MSPVPAPAYSISANLRWFAVLYTVVTVVVAIAMEAAYRFGVEIPAVGANIGVFAGVSLAAGQRFASKNQGNWSGKDRHQLALGYVIVSFLVSFALLGVLMLIDPAVGAELTSVFSVLGVFLAVMFAIVALVFYGMARFMLMSAAKRGERRDS